MFQQQLLKPIVKYECARLVQCSVCMYVCMYVDNQPVLICWSFAMMVINTEKIGGPMNAFFLT